MSRKGLFGVHGKSGKGQWLYKNKRGIIAFRFLGSRRFPLPVHRRTKEPDPDRGVIRGCKRWISWQKR